MNLVSHEHPPEELDAPVWTITRLSAHLEALHNLTPRTGDVQALAAIHAAEHPEQAGIAETVLAGKDVPTASPPPKPDHEA